MYFITTLTPEGDARCVGYVPSLDAAINIVENNIGDLYEVGYYPYAIIENIEEGLYQYDSNPLWFTYNKKTNKYEKSVPPPFHENYWVGYAIG